MNKVCKDCKRIIMEDFEKWLKENPQQEYIQCPLCFGLEKIK